MTAGARCADRITLGQAKVLLSAAQRAGMSARDLATLVVSMTGVETLDELTPGGWADVMDHFVIDGFRHALVPMVTAEQLDALDESRRNLGLSGSHFVALVRQFGGVRARRRLDGAGFLAVWQAMAQAGSGVPVPGHGFVTRKLMRFVHDAVYQQSMTADELLGLLAPIGGVLRASQLDRRGFLRVMLVLYRRGAPLSTRAPAVPASTGMVTQAQANLVWRLWLDFGGWNDDTSPAALDAAIGSLIGMDRGLVSLTRAGARAAIDRFMVPKLKYRELE